MLDKIKQIFGKRKSRKKISDVLVYTNSELTIIARIATPHDEML